MPTVVCDGACDSKLAEAVARQAKGRGGASNGFAALLQDDDDEEEEEEEEDAAELLAQLFPREHPVAEGSLTIWQDPHARLAAGCGATVWDAALSLAGMIQRRGQLAGSRVLEVGAGTGLVGLAAARLGAREVVLADHPRCGPAGSGSPGGRALRLLEVNLAANRQPGVSVKPLEWGNPEHAAGLGGQFDLVLVADCVHWPELFTPLCETLGEVVGPGTECLISYEERNSQVEAAFFKELNGRFRVEEVPEEQLEPQYRADEIHIFRVTHA